MWSKATASRSRLPPELMLLVVAHHEEMVAQSLTAPDLAGHAAELRDVGRGAVGHGRERLRHRIESHDGLSPRVGEPDLVVMIDVHGVSSRGVSTGELPLAPLAVRRVVDANLAHIVLGDPEPTRRIGPDPAHAGVRRWRIELRHASI